MVLLRELLFFVLVDILDLNNSHLDGKTPSYLVLDQLLYGKTYWGLQGLELGVSGRKLAFSAGRSKTPAVSSQDAPRSLPRALWSSLPFRQSRGLTFRVASSWDRMIFNQKISI